MSEEEEHAIWYFSEAYDEEDVKQWKVIENLIEKQQNKIASKEKQIKLMQSCDLAKVIKEQQNEIEKQQEEIEQLANGIRVLGTNPDITTEEIIKEFTEKPITEEYMEEFKNRYISKDKILKALGYEENGEEYKRIYNKEELILSLIRTINEECDRLEDIEDQKTMLEIHNIENQRDKYWKDKLEEIIGWNIVVKDEKSNNYRPIKNTSAQDVYEAFYKIRKLLKEPHNVSKDKIREYVNSPEFLDWHLGFTLLDELEYRKNNINKLLEEK